MRALDVDPVHGTRACFRALVSAMSRPGTVERVDAPADRTVVATLVDHEVGLATDDGALADALAREGRLTEAAPGDADVVHALEPTGGSVREFARGTLAEPSEGATVVYRVEDLRGDPEGAAGTATVELTGPGVDGRRRLSVAGLPAAELRALADAQSTYPRGVDAVLAGEERLAALPRSVELEVA